MPSNILLITPPFTQLNTPYPATAYLKGFLNTKGIQSYQTDLGIEVILDIFSKKGLEKIFTVAVDTENMSSNSTRIVKLKSSYIQTIDSVIQFLQGKNPTLADLICQRNFLPEASRFDQLDDMQWAFGAMGIQDKAKHLATLYIEDISDYIKECVDEHFGFSRYAERMGRSANTFDELYDALQKPLSYIDEVHIELLRKLIETQTPKLVALSVPFPGNLFSAFRSAQWINKNYPEIKIVLGGGFPNTELRSISDARVFEFIDFITLDDGESPIECLIEYLNEKRKIEQLKRTFTLIDGNVIFINNASCNDYKQHEVGTPDYCDLLLDKYISVIEIANPMHRLWSDGRWNKLTMAHGCYWGKCTFCDITLPYIKDYEPLTAYLLCDRMEELIAQTGTSGFHFVDEAAPPALMRSFALEIIKRKLVVTWWTNIRFEKSFTKDLCLLLKASGCIAVSGGLEVASDRLLALIQKGVTVAQVAKVTQHFTQAGIMVHAYLMYGFPTQTPQETIDSLEMVRQLFQAGVLQSAYWHQFAMTAHSPVGLSPTDFHVSIENNELGTFANNDLIHTDKKGAQHESYNFGLTKSLFNYMHLNCFDKPLQEWFDFKVPKTSIEPNYIEHILSNSEIKNIKPTAKVIYIGVLPSIAFQTQSKKGRQRELAILTFQTLKKQINIQLNKTEGEWLLTILNKASIDNQQTVTFAEIMSNYEQEGLEDFDLFWYNKPMNTLSDVGVFIL
jgi:radical SAM superfamily enzyme YgiQ (UPF0313 family)